MDPEATSLLIAVRSHLVQLFRAPRTELLALAFNAAVVFGGWIVLPRGLRDWTFSVQGALAFSIVLETWMLGDVISTNTMTLNREQVLPLLRDPRALRRFLRAHTAAMALLVGTLCAVVTLGIAVYIHRYVGGLAIAVTGYAIALYALAVAGWLGILFPYHPRSLHWRWENRKPWSRTLRWLILRFVPYTVLAALVAALLGLLIAVAVAVGGHPEGHHLSQRGVLAGALVASMLAPILWWVATDLASRLAVRRADALTTYLHDPERG